MKLFSDFVVRWISLFFLLAGSTAITRGETFFPARFSGKDYSLVFQSDGRVEWYARQDRREVLLGTFGGFEFPAGKASFSGPVTLQTRLRSISESEKVRYTYIATAVDDRSSDWPVVNVDYKGKGGTLNVRWYILPQMVHVKYVITLAEGIPRVEGPAAVKFKPAKPATMVQCIKPARWIRHPYGGVPFQKTWGMAERFRVNGFSFLMAGNHGWDSLFDAKKEEVSLFVQDDPRPFLSNELQADLVLAVGSSEKTMFPAIAKASNDRLLLKTVSPQPFYLWSDLKQPIELKSRIVNLFYKPQRVDLNYIARDFDGVKVAEGHVFRRLNPLENWEVPITLVPLQSGPIYLEIVGQSGCQAMFENLCVGVLPDRKFLDEKNSRFGISAYRTYTGAHTEARPERDVLGLMKRIGVRWLRAADNHRLAQQMGFFTWYQNDLSGGPAVEDYRQGRTSWMNDPKNRENWLRANLELVLKQGDVCFEYSNEWNLYGGECKGVLAEKYVRDWLVPIKKLRDEMSPGVKLAGAVVCNADLTFLDKMYRAGGWDKFDYLDFHASGNPRSPDFDDGQTYWSYLATLRQIHQVMKKYGKKELWMTEVYAPSAPNNSCSNNERVSAEDLTLICALALAADVRGWMYYCFDDFDRGPEIKTLPQTDEPSIREDYFGLVRRDWTPKAGLWAYQTAAYFFDGARFVGDIRMPAKDLFGLLFEGRNGRFGVLWSRKEGYLQHEPSFPRSAHRPPWQPGWALQTPISLSSAGPAVTVVDCVGRSRTLKPDGHGNVTLDLTGAPVYVFGAKLTPFSGRFAKIFSAP